MLLATKQVTTHFNWSAETIQIVICPQVHIPKWLQVRLFTLPTNEVSALMETYKDGIKE
jgi:hypothetical protein